MDAATFDAYVANNPAPGTTIGGVTWGGAVPGSGTGGPNKPNDFWGNFFSAGAGNTRAPIGLDTTNADQARGWQQNLMQDLQRRAAGDPNSRAQQSLTQGYADARAGQSALGSSMRGTGGGAGLRAGVQGAGNVQRGYAGDQQMLMTQEKQGAQALLAQQLAQMRGQDAGQAGMAAQNMMGNQGLDDAMSQFYTSQGIGHDIAGTQRAVDLGRASLGISDARNEIGREGAKDLAQAGATGLATISRFAGSGGNKGGGYRQVDGQNSIVPEWDK